MRRTVSWCVVLGTIAALPLGAQMPRASSSRVALGPIVGLNYTTFYGSDASESNSRADFALGGQIDDNFGQGGLFRTGLVYSRRGAEWSQSGTTLKFKVSYLELPLLLGYRFPTSGSSVRPYFMGGGNLGLKVGCSLEGSGGGATVSVGCDDQNVGLDVSSLDFALLGGGGVSVPMGTSSLSFDVRYALGLTKVVKDAEVKNRGFTFAVAYMFPTGR